MKEKVMFFLFTYPAGILLGIGLLLLRAFRRIKILHLERLPRWKRKIIVVSNHPSLLEPMLLPALFFRSYLFHPFKYAPWSVPDRRNYYDKWYWFFARPRLIPVERGNNRAGMKVLFSDIITIPSPSLRTSSPDILSRYPIPTSFPDILSRQQPIKDHTPNNCHGNYSEYG